MPPTVTVKMIDRTNHGLSARTVPDKLLGVFKDQRPFNLERH